MDRPLVYGVNRGVHVALSSPKDKNTSYQTKNAPNEGNARLDTRLEVTQ